MIFRKTDSREPVIELLANRIKSSLQNDKKVLWLVTGGSNIETAVAVSKRLSGSNLQNLHVALTDERYGPVGHSDSNWQQLLKAGFSPPGAQLYPILNGNQPQQTTRDYRQLLSKWLQAADDRIGLIGVGSDNHIAGIKPGSPAVKETSKAAYYVWDDFKRITMSFPAILSLDTCISYLLGEDKRQAIANLQKDLNIDDFPAQILKQAKEAIIFNDLVGEEGR